MRDVLIIGSGPAGITAAIYAKRANLDVLLLEKEYEGTGQIAESPCVDNYPGLPGISGYELGLEAEILHWMMRCCCRKSAGRFFLYTGEKASGEHMVL